MTTKHTPGPFDHVEEAHRPRATGKTARHNAPIYHNPGCNPPEDCALDRKTGFLYTLNAWEKVCDKRERDAAPELLKALQRAQPTIERLAAEGNSVAETIRDEIRAAIAKATS